MVPILRLVHDLGPPDRSGPDRVPSLKLADSRTDDWGGFADVVCAYLFARVVLSGSRAELKLVTPMSPRLAGRQPPSRANLTRSDTFENGLSDDVRIQVWAGNGQIPILRL